MEELYFEATIRACEENHVDFTSVDLSMKQLTDGNSSRVTSARRPCRPHPRLFAAVILNQWQLFRDPIFGDDVPFLYKNYKFIGAGRLSLQCSASLASAPGISRIGITDPASCFRSSFPSPPISFFCGLIYFIHVHVASSLTPQFELVQIERLAQCLEKNTRVTTVDMFGSAVNLDTQRVSNWIKFVRVNLSLFLSCW